MLERSRFAKRRIMGGLAQINLSPELSGRDCPRDGFNTGKSHVVTTSSLHDKTVRFTPD